MDEYTQFSPVRLAGGFASVVEFERVPANGEVAGPREFSLRRYGDVSQPARVSVSTMLGGSATPQVDFKPLPPTVVSFAAGEHRKTASVEILDDEEVERDEAFALSMERPSFGVRGARARVGVAITRQATGRVGFSLGTTQATEQDGFVEVPINRTEDLEGALTVGIEISGTEGAVAGRDFLPPPSQMTIPSGAKSALWRLQLLDDDLREPTRKISIRITAFQKGRGST